MALLCRLISLGLYPLTDPTEGRYADIGRRIVETGDWVTPWIDTGIPFWGKPPLSFWMTSSSLEVFGQSVFAARLPHFLAGVLILWILLDLFKRQSLIEIGHYAVAITTGSIIFYIASGAVMTDAALAVGCTVAMRGFWLSLNGPSEIRHRECYVFFLGLAIGLLAKGPLVFILCLAPAGIWVLYTRNLKKFLFQLPWIRGALLMVLIAIPWYVIAEIHSPGFLEYFIVGEHWQRYLQKDWSGDLYGKGHGKPLGIIWLYGLIGMMPWTVLLPLVAWVTRGTMTQKSVQYPPHTILYFALWGLAPLGFFSLSSNVLIAYVLPSIPPLSCVAALWLGRKSTGKAIQRSLIVGLTLTITVSLLAVAYLHFSNKNEYISTESLVHIYTVNEKHGEPLYFYQAVPASAKFYTSGMSQALVSNDEIASLISSRKAAFIALHDKQMQMISGDLKVQLVTVQRSGPFTLYSVSRKEE